MTIHTPPQCVNSVMAAAPTATARVVLLDAGSFGGFSSYLNETWTFTGTDWTDKSTGTINSNGPLPTRQNACMCFDGYNTMMFGGQGGSSAAGILDDTWVWSSNTTWTQYTGPGFALAGPFGRMGAEAAYLTSIGGGGGAVMFGGQNLLSNLLETWIWDGGLKIWTLLSIANGSSPNARVGHCFTSNNSTTAVLFGGQGTNQQFNDTWTFTYSGGVGTWTQKFPTTVPSVRSNACMAYTGSGGVLVMFGGENEYGYLDETWTYTIGTNTWTQVVFANGVGPSGRIGATMALDATSGNVIMFGGQTATAGYAVNETWSFNGTVWSQL